MSSILAHPARIVLLLLALAAGWVAATIGGVTSSVRAQAAETAWLEDTVELMDAEFSGTANPAENVLTRETLARSVAAAYSSGGPVIAQKRADSRSTEELDALGELIDTYLVDKATLYNLVADQLAADVRAADDPQIQLQLAALAKQREAIRAGLTEHAPPELLAIWEENVASLERLAPTSSPAPAGQV